MNRLPPTWATAPLRCAGPVFGGGTPDTANEAYWDGDIPWVSSQDVRGRSIVGTSRSITAAGLTGSSAQMAHAGDLAFVMRSGILRHTLPVGVLAVDAAVNQDIKVLRPTGPWLAPYVAYFVEGLQRELLGEWRSEGTTVESLRLDLMLRTPLPVPLEPTQKAIVDFLDRETEKIDALVAKKQRLIELLQEKRTALISRAVTKGLDPDVPLKDSGIEWLGAIPAEWDAVPLGRIASSLQTGPFGSQLHSHEYIDDGTPVINPSNLRDGRVIPDWRCSVDEETAGRLNRHRVEAGDIVFGRRGEMGRCGLVRPAEEGWLCGTGCLRVKLQDELAVPAFFVLQLATNRVRDWLLLESVGSTMDNLNTSVVSRIPVAVPPVGTQHHIVSILAAHTAGLDTLATRVEAAIGCLGELRSALITAAVTGQVDVRAAL